MPPKKQIKDDSYDDESDENSGIDLIDLIDVGDDGGNIGTKSVSVIMPGPIRKVFSSLFLPKSQRITEWIIFTVQDAEDPNVWYTATKSRMYPDGKWKVEEAKVVESKNVGRKNERLGEAQATAEAQSKFDVKCRKQHGTVVLKDAQKFFEHEAVGNVDKYELRPMLGKDIVEKKLKASEKTKINSKGKVFADARLKYPVIVQKKLNGVHVLVFWDNELKKVVMISRTGLVFTVFGQIEESLKPWFRKNKSIVLDGELYSHDEWSFQALSGITRKKKLEELKPEQKKALPHIIVNLFDYLDLENPEAVYTERMESAKTSLQPFLDDLDEYDEYVPVEILDYHMADSKKEIDKIYEKFLDDGFEGAMLRNDDTYIWGKRVSDRLFKYKPQFDDEFKLIGFEEGTGKFATTPIWIFETPEGKPFKSTPTGTLDDRKQIFAELQTDSGKKKYLNKKYTVYFYGYSEDNIPIQSNVDTPPFNKHKGGI